MFLKKMPQKNGRVKLAVYECYREDGKAKQRTVLPLGYIDELIEKHDDPIEWGKKLAAQMTEEKKAQEQSVSIEIHPKQKIDKKASNEKNIGSAIALSQYYALGIETAIRSATRNTQTKYDLNAILRLLVCERIVSPRSKRSAWQNKGNYFFKSDFSCDDVYRSLDVLAEIKNNILSAINRNIDKANIRNTTCVYYDVTNYYFEIDQEDELRKKGVSKEHRPNPIVQMGLLQDS